MTLLLDILGLLGQCGIAVAMFVLAALSHRLGLVTHARPRYRWLYVAMVLVLVGAGVRLFYLTNSDISHDNLKQNLVYILICDGFPALGITLALLVTWYYWSWLLAERD
jgi:hypothetical protein